MTAVLVPLVILAGWHDADDAARPVKTYFALMLVLETLDDRRLRGHRRVPVLRVLRGHADPDVLPDRRFGGPQRSVRGGEVPAVQPARRAAHAGRGDRPVRGLRPRARHRHLRLRCARATCHIDVGTAEAGCSSASSSRSRSRRRCGRSTPGCPTPPRSRRPATAVLLVGVLDKVGTFGMLRYCLPLFPDASRYFAPACRHLAVIGDPLRRAPGDRPDRHEAADRLHLDLPLRLHRAGHLRVDQPGQSGSTLYMVNHGFSTAALFLIAGFLVAGAARADRATTAGCRRSRRCWPACS